MGYMQVSLREMLEELGEEAVRARLETFSCPLNPDVERFLTRRSYAIEFCRQGIAQTTLVFASYQGNLELAGYYTIALKTIIVPFQPLSNSWRKRIRKFASYDTINGGYSLAVPLIAQLGKNYMKGFDTLISGDELLALACSRVAQAQLAIGGRFTYIECEDVPKLVDFYARNGFVNFGKRLLDRDEQSDYEKNYLVQMLKYLK